MNSRIALLSLFLILTLGSHSAGAGQTPTPQREIVILMLWDAVRADHVGAYGYERPTTPVLDKLARKGVRYTRAYVNAPWTRSSTASFLSGLNASRHRTETAKSKVPKDVLALAQRLKRVGWATAGFSANGNGGSLAGLHKGFDVFEDPTNTYVRKGRKARCKKEFPKIDKSNYKLAVRADCIRYNRLPTGEFITHRVLEHLKNSKAQKEFIFIFFVDPHDPYGAPAWLEKKFLGKDFKGKIRRKALWERNNDYPADERFSIMAIYDAGIRYADIALGQLVEGMAQLGLDDNTTLFITADHGEGFGEHGFYLHAHHFWEEVIRVPLVAIGPRFKSGVDKRLTQSLDVSATIAELAGASLEGLMGHSLLLAPPEGRPIISEYNEFGIHRQAIVGERYKVIWQRPADEEWYLREAKNKKFFPSVSFDKDVVRVFDLQADPQEKNDLASKMPAPAQKLLDQLKSFVHESDRLSGNK